MASTNDEYTILHFSQTSGVGPSQGDVPALLRRIAQSISELGEVDVQDITFHNELDDDGDDFPSMTVYYSRRDAEEEA